MDWRRPTWWPLQRGRSRRSQDPGAALFEGLRIRLTLWYCGVLGTALVLFGVALYFGAQISLFSPINADAQMHAQAHARDWMSGQSDRACPPFGPFGSPGQQFLMPELVVCFDGNGSLLPGEDTSGLPSTFLANTLAKSAIQSGQPETDIVNAGGTSIYRYALLVANPTGSGNLGVVVIGEVAQAQVSTLSSLLTLLLTIGGVALLGAGLGGLFLANRALAPARLAWANQQRFIADAAHELRTPLTLLRADAEVLLRGRERLAVDDSALLEDIVAETSHMSTIATNLLTLARLDSGTIHREHEVVSLAEVAQEGARRVQAFAEQRDITLQVESANDPYVIGDPTLLEQAAMVLLDNAIKYNRAGGRVIVCTEVQDGEALLEVRDTGVGIPAEHLPHLGERFYRVDKARSREAGGTGLGLSIAQRIAVAHGGRLSLSSILDRGTTATLMLPLLHGPRSGNMEEEMGNITSLPEQSV